MATNSYDQETKDRAVRLYFDQLADGATSKSAARRAVEAATGIKQTTLRNWVTVVEKKNDTAVQQSDAEKDAELKALRKENSRLKEANEILKMASAFFAQAELDRKLK